MVNYLLDRTFLALADPTRRRMLSRLAQGQASVTELAAPFQISLPAVSKHLRVLEEAGLLLRRKEGRTYRCSLAGRPLKEAAFWIARYRAFWGSRLDALAGHLDEPNGSVGPEEGAAGEAGLAPNSTGTAPLFSRTSGRRAQRDSLSTTFSALADPTRRQILARLAEREAFVTELAQPFQISLPAISKHLRVLQNAGLLVRQKEGRRYRCRLVATPMKEASAWIDRYKQFWEEQFDALARYLNEPNRREDP